MQPQPQTVPLASMAKPSNAAHIREDFVQYVAKACGLVNSKATRAQMLEGLKGPDPAKQIARATDVIMARMDTAARQAGVEVLDTIKIVATYNIVENLYGLAEAAGLYKLEQDYRTLAMGIAIQDYINAEVKAGRVNKKALAVQFARDMRAMTPQQKKQVADATSKMPLIAKRYHKDLRAGKFQGGA